MSRSGCVPHRFSRLVGVARWLATPALVILTVVSSPAGLNPALDELLPGSSGFSGEGPRLECPRSAISLPGEPARAEVTRGGRGIASSPSPAGLRDPATPTDVLVTCEGPRHRGSLQTAPPVGHAGSLRPGPDPCRGPPCVS